MDNNNLKNLKKYVTGKEIVQQPELWMKTYDTILFQKMELSMFLEHVFARPAIEVIFTGAGSSFFIAETVVGRFQYNTGITSKAISTTELVTHPDIYINASKPTLLVSYARSGDSPESVATVDLVNKAGGEVYHLIITCNKDGELAKMSLDDNAYILLLPEEANDKGLAMTGSVTSMTLATLLVSRISEVELLGHQVQRAILYAKKVFSDYIDEIQQVADMDFKRGIFLGSGPFIGIARESHLKVQELTDGDIICKFDSFMSFRHGPRAIINEKSLVVSILTNNEYASQYEKDLVDSINETQKPMFTIGIMETDMGSKFDLPIILSDGEKQIDEGFLTICSLIPSQLLGFFKSIALGFNPDSPSKSGTIHRVVQGVKIYKYE